MSNASFRMCKGKVRFDSAASALAEAVLQESHRPHWRFTYYDCLWCDFFHIGRSGPREGHDHSCQSECERRAVHARALRILEGTW